MEFNYKQHPGRRLINRKVHIDGEPLVSIITPYYNAQKYFRETFNSVLNQTFPYFEWIIVNDGSTDEDDVKQLLELAEKDPRIKVYHKENGGIATARNLAIEKSTTDIIIPLDADDLIEPTFVECVYWSLYANPEASWSYANVVGFFHQEYLWNKSFIAKQMKEENLLTCTAGIRKKDLLEVGCYDELEKHYNEDWVLWLKLLAKGKYPVHMNWYGLWYRRTEEGVLNIVESNEDINKRAKKIIQEAAAKVDDKIEAIEFPRYRIGEFEKPRKWEWERKPILGDEKIKVLMLIPHMEMGGADVFNLDLVSRINKEEFEMSVIMTNPGNSTWRQKFEEHVVDIFDLTTFLDIKDWSAFIHYFIKSRGIDIVLISNSYYGYYLVPWLRKEFPDIGIIDYVHMEEWYWRAGGYARTSGVAGDIIERTYVCNEHLRELMIEKFHRKPEDVKTVYIGVDEKEFHAEGIDRGRVKKELGIQEGRPVILYPCRIHPQKRPFLMMEIAKEIKKEISDIVFWVIGDGPELPDLEEAVRKNNLTGTVYLLGRQQDMKRYYRDSDVTLICSIKEGLSLTAYESLSMGVPVVSSDVGGQRELIDERVGRLVQVLQDERKDFDKREYSREEVRRYVDAILDILRDEDGYQEMKEECRRRIEERFTKEKMVKELEKEFKEIKGGRGKERRQKVWEAVQMLPNLVDDYCTLFCEYEAMNVLYNRNHKIIQYLKDVLSFRKSLKDIVKDFYKYQNKYFIAKYKQRISISKFGFMFRVFGKCFRRQ